MSNLRFNQGSAPSTPASAKSAMYVDSADRVPKVIDDKGVIARCGQPQSWNWIRNSGMRFFRKQVPSGLTTYSNTTGRTQHADGWGITNENTSVTVRRVDTGSAPETGLQGRYYAELLKTTLTGKMFLTQCVQGIDTCMIRGRTVRVQAWVKSSTGTPTINIALIQLSAAGTIDAPPATFISAANGAGTDPTIGANLSYIAPKSGVTPDNCTVDGNHVELVSSTSWQRFGAVFDVPSNAKNLFVMIYGDGTFLATAGFNVSQVSLTDGYEIQDWAPMNDYAELVRLNEYAKSFNVDTGPATNAGANTGEFKFQCTVGGAAAFAGQGINFNNPLRAAPTVVTLYNPNAANAQIRNITDGADCSASAATANGEQGLWINGTSSASAAAGEHLAVHWSAEAFL